MGERTRYEPGTVCWTDVATTDLAGAKAFYEPLLGWEFEDTVADGSAAYTRARIGGLDVCGLYQRSAEHGPPAWLSYVSVEDANEVTERARQLGATVVEEPFDVMEGMGSEEEATALGRVGLLVDPAGAFFALWQAGTHIGASLVNDPGAMCLNQLNTDDTESAQHFYGQLLGWRFEPVGTDTQPYWGIFNGDALNGGMMPLPPDTGTPPHWLVYFTSADIDVSARRHHRARGHRDRPAHAHPHGAHRRRPRPPGRTLRPLRGQRRSLTLTPDSAGSAADRDHCSRRRSSARCR